MWQKLVQALASERPQPKERRRLAAAVLLLETARADFTHSDAELDSVREALLSVLGLSAEDAEQLLHEGIAAARHSVSLHEHVQAINHEMSAEDKRELVAALWRVAHADGRVDAQEEHLIRRLADLLHVPHHEFIRGKLSAGPT